MPDFDVHIPAGRILPERKRRCTNALNQSLVQGLGIPKGDRFIMISQHDDDELFLDALPQSRRDKKAAKRLSVARDDHLGNVQNER
jgi:hypothetical protein